MEKSFFYSDALQSRIPTSPPTKLPEQSLQVLAVHNTNQRASETGLPLHTPLLPQLAEAASAVNLL